MIKAGQESWSKYIYCKFHACHCELLKKQTLSNLLCPKRVWNQAWPLSGQTYVLIWIWQFMPQKLREIQMGWANYEIICSLLMQKVFFTNLIFPKLSIEIELSHLQRIGINGNIWNFECLKFLHSSWIFGTQNSPLTSFSYWKFQLGSWSWNIVTWRALWYVKGKVSNI